MQIKGLFQLSVLTTAIALTGCGGDVNITPVVNDSSVRDSNNSITNPSAPVDTNPCTTRGELQGSFDGQDCTYSAAFASKNIEIDEDLTFAALEDGGVHSFAGALLIGKDCNTTTGCTVAANGPTLSVEAGATLAFSSGEAIIRIGRGAKINAIGTAEAPITFTSAAAFPRLDVVGQGAQYADWGGIIINGFGLTNQCTNAERDAGTCNATTEGVLSHFGGNDNADSSGNIQFANIWYAGSGPRVGGEGDDLNSLTLNGVGAGSLFDFIHIHQGFDDGIEFFGGAANISHIVVTDTQDDAIDIDAGWQGNAQYIFVKHGTVDTRSGETVYMGNHGFETDGEKNGGEEYSQAPTSNPIIANVTVVTQDGVSVRDGDPSVAFKFDDAIKTAYYNVLMVKESNTETGASCIAHSSDGEKNADMVSFTSSVMACIDEFGGEQSFVSGKEPSALTSVAKSVWFDNNGSSERIGGNAMVLSNAFATDTTSTDITVTATDVSTVNGFFEATNYIGAVSNQDTSSEWYKWVEAAVTAAAND